ncbi:MAG: BatD family protein, partial [Spirochaetaceae bacterium]|nr:BatD family protein [Spirochaetaceae bacterium]
SLSDGETRLSTEPLIFSVLAYDERDLKYPVFAKWNNIPGQIFVGETIPLILEMENLDELSFPERITMIPPNGGMFEKVDSVGEISVTSIGDDEVYIAPIESWLFTPTEAGRIKIPAATVSFKQIKRTTDSPVIEVLETPAEIEFSGAIGDFQVSTRMENLSLQKGNTLTLRIRVEGEGNLNYLKMPQPELNGLTLIEKEELYNIEPSLLGYNGYREDVYRVSLGEEQDVSVLFNPWSWYSRISANVETETLRDYQLQNETVQPIENNKSLSDEYSLLTPGKIVKYQKPFYKSPWYYLLILPGIISVVAGFIQKKVPVKILGYFLILLSMTSSAVSDDPEYRESLDSVEKIIDSGNTREALLAYEQILSDYGDNPGIAFNQSLLNYELKQNDKVIFFLRKSLVLKPGDRLFTNALTSAEAEFGLEHQVAASTGLSPDLFLLFFLLLFNLGTLVIVLNMGRRKIELSILAVMIFFLSIGSLFIIYYTHQVSRRETAVVLHPGGELKKVPGIKGGSWLTLQEGTAVSLLSESDDSLLIRTGYGLEGWLHKDSLLLLYGGNE